MIFEGDAAMPTKYKYERVTFYHNGKRYECVGKTLKEAHAKAGKLNKE